MDEHIKEHLKYLHKYYLHLSDIRQRDYETFVEDIILGGAAERFLQLAIESCLNIGNRLLSLYQFKKPVNTPETYSDIFLEMKNLRVIDAEFCDRLVQMAKFRNRLVHLYWELDKEKTYQIIQENLEDFNLFQKKVVDFLKKNKL